VHFLQCLGYDYQPTGWLTSIFKEQTTPQSIHTRQALLIMFGSLNIKGTGVQRPIKYTKFIGLYISP